MIGPWLVPFMLLAAMLVATDSPNAQTTRQEAPGTAPGAEPRERPDRSGAGADPVPHGVIRPPPDAGAPGIHVQPPVPDPNTTPVIPPPGTPGGDPRVDPR